MLRALQSLPGLRTGPLMSFAPPVRRAPGPLPFFAVEHSAGSQCAVDEGGPKQQSAVFGSRSAPGTAKAHSSHFQAFSEAGARWAAILPRAPLWEGCFWEMEMCRFSGWAVLGWKSCVARRQRKAAFGVVRLGRWRIGSVSVGWVWIDLKHGSCRHLVQAFRRQSGEAMSAATGAVISRASQCAIVWTFVFSVYPPGARQAHVMFWKRAGLDGGPVPASRHCRRRLGFGQGRCRTLFLVRGEVAGIISKPPVTGLVCSPTWGP